MSLAKITVIGNLGKDAIVNNVNGKNVINFSLAHTEKFNDAGGVAKEKTTWFECAKWGDQVAVAGYMKSGGQIYVEGIPELRTYTTKDGNHGASIMIRVGIIQLLGGAPQGQQQGQQQQPQQQYQQAQQQAHNNQYGTGQQQQNNGRDYAQQVGNPQGNYSNQQQPQQQYQQQPQQQQNNGGGLPPSVDDLPF